MSHFTHQSINAIRENRRRERQLQEGAELRKAFQDPRAKLFYGDSMGDDGLGLTEEQKLQKVIELEKQEEEANRKLLNGEISFGEALYHTSLDSMYKGRTDPEKEKPRDDYANPWARFFGTIDGFVEFHAALVRNEYNPYYAWREVKGTDEGLQEFLDFHNSFHF